MVLSSTIDSRMENHVIALTKKVVGNVDVVFRIRRRMGKVGRKGNCWVNIKLFHIVVCSEVKKQSNKI